MSAATAVLVDAEPAAQAGSKAAAKPGARRATTVTRSLPARLGGLGVNLALVALFIAAVAYIVPSFLGYQRYIITSGSMTGTYDQGSIVFDQVEPVADLKVGDVITYLPPPASGVTNLVTHRIYAVHRNADGERIFRTKGDFNPSPDPWKFTLDKSTQPVVGFHVAHLGWAFLWLANPQHRMLVIGTPAALVALLALLEAGRNARTARREQLERTVAAA